MTGCGKGQEGSGHRRVAVCTGASGPGRWPSPASRGPFRATAPPRDEQPRLGPRPLRPKRKSRVLVVFASSHRAEPSSTYSLDASPSARRAPEQRGGICEESSASVKSDEAPQRSLAPLPRIAPNFARAPSSGHVGPDHLSAHPSHTLFPRARARVKSAAAPHRRGEGGVLGKS